MPLPAPRVLLALLAVYLIWGSTYLAMRWTIEGLPALFSAGFRYLVAGFLLFLLLRWRHHDLPTRRQWCHAGLVGVLLLLGGNGAVAVAMSLGVNSALSATVVAITPLCATVFAGFWGYRAGRLEWLGLLLGLAGVWLLAQGQGLSGSPAGLALLIFAALSWSFGSMWGKRLDQPGVWMACAVQMLVGGLALLLTSLLAGEHWRLPDSVASVWALAYLIFIGALVGFSSYVYLLATVRPALATSYAYVNPLVAVLLGVWLGGEQVDRHELAGLVVIVAGVVLVCWPRKDPTKVG